MRERGGVQISRSSQKPLQIRQAGHMRDTNVWPVAYLRITSHPELRANDSPGPNKSFGSSTSKF